MMIPPGMTPRALGIAPQPSPQFIAAGGSAMPLATSPMNASPMTIPVMPIMPVWNQFYPDLSTSSLTLGWPTQAVLRNGASAYFQQASQQKESSLSILLPIGPALAGSRALIPGLLLEGSDATKQLINRVRAEGIVVLASETGDKVLLHLTGPAGQEARLTQVAMQVLTQPTVDPMTFQRLKEDMSDDLKKSLAMPETAMAEAVAQQLYGPTHPYAKTTQALMQELAQQTPASVMGLYQTVLQQPQDITLLMVSPQSVPVQQQVLNGALAQVGWQGNPFGAAMALPQTPPLPPQRGAIGPLLIPNETVDRARVIQAWRAPTVDDPDYPAFLLLINMLNGMTGGFFRVLRTESGLVYSTRQLYQPEKQGASYQVTAQVDYDKLGQTLQAIQRVATEMLTRPISEEELNKVKRSYILGLRQDMQSSSGITDIHLPRVGVDRPPLHPDILKSQVEQVTGADVQRVANRFFNPANGYFVLGVTAPQRVLSAWFPPPPAAFVGYPGA